MMRAMYSAIAGLKTHQVLLDVTANNLANVNTVGYKGARATFSDALSQRSAPAPRRPPARAARTRPGRPRRPPRLDRQHDGRRRASSRPATPLDVAVQGEGWFRVDEHGAGLTDPTANPPDASSINYTRAGNFIAQRPGHTRHPGRLLRRRHERRRPPARAPRRRTSTSRRTPPTCRSARTARSASSRRRATPRWQASDADGRVVAGYLSLAKFPNEPGMERVADNRWRASGSSGAEVVDTPGVNGFGASIGGSLEMSNVDLATEFTHDDHGAARLPGQLARDLDRRPDAVRTWSTSAAKAP